MIRIGMSTSCVFPLSLDDAFRLARLAGFDGVEIMVTHDTLTRDASALRDLSRRYGIPILSIHAPVLFLTQLVWGIEPAEKIVRSAQLAVEVGASTVVAHPPFRWQSRYARGFETLVRGVSLAYDIEVAVENMFAWHPGDRELRAYAPSATPTDLDVDSMTLDFSHAAMDGADSLRLARAMGDRLRHVHLCDGNGGELFDEHLVPGHGRQPVAEVLRMLADRDWDGSVVAEVGTRSGRDDAGRLALLRETLEFARNATAPAGGGATRSTERDRGRAPSERA